MTSSSLSFQAQLLNHYKSILSYDVVSSGKRCPSCHVPFTEMPPDQIMQDGGALFTVFPPFLDFRPLRYICKNCQTDRVRMAYLYLFDQLAFNYLPVQLSTEWKKRAIDETVTVHFRTEDMYYPKCTFYFEKNDTKENVTWIRVIDEDKRDVQPESQIVISVKEPKSRNFKMAPLSTLMQWNQESKRPLDPFTFYADLPPPLDQGHFDETYFQKIASGNEEVLARWKVVRAFFQPFRDTKQQQKIAFEQFTRSVETFNQTCICSHPKRYHLSLAHNCICQSVCKCLSFVEEHRRSHRKRKQVDYKEHKTIQKPVFNELHVMTNE